MNRRTRLAALTALAATLAAASTDAQQSSSDPAQRGLDLFIHAPESAAPGSLVPVQIEAFGFPSVVSLVPLAGATVEAAWDPESLGPGISKAPPAIRATTDSAGKLHLDVPVPDGDVRKLDLLLGLRLGVHERTRKITIERGPAERIALHVADTRVVPGSSISAWVTVTRAATGEPAGGAPIELSLIEGGYARTRIKLVADGAGTAMARVPIPPTEEPSWTWQLKARSLSTGERDAAHDAIQLSPREETPGSPWISARFDDTAVLAGDHPRFTLRVRDATDQPIAGLPIRYWVGPRGTEPPKDQKGWELVSTRALTDGAGEISATADAPTTIVAGVGTTLRVIARTKVEGHDLEDTAVVSVGVPTATAALLPEAGSILPGIEQRMLLRMRDGRGQPIRAGFLVEGDGLKAQVETDDHGEAEITWHPPLEVGALRNVGPCAGGVAAAVIVRPVGEVPALRPRRDPFELCVSIDRDATALLRPERPIATIGDKLRVRVIAPDMPRGKAQGPLPSWSTILRAPNGEQAASTWIDDGERGGDITVPSAAAGTWSLSAASPGTSRASRVVGNAVLVAPRILPKLVAQIGGGRIAPGGSIEVDADLRDAQGHGLPGTIAAVVVDLHGGGSTAGLESLDTRRSLCRPLGVEPARCDAFVDGDPALDPLRRAQLGAAASGPIQPENDPAKNAEETLNQAFGEVLRSLEGAVFEAAQSADRLRDVRRRGANGWAFNPELMTLVTAAMSRPPETPGGERLSLVDLLAVDPQVTFDNVARRVTRLKLFRVLSAVRAFRKERSLDPDEPVFKNPNALLRRLVRDGRLTEDLLLDPWGGTIQFTPSAGPPIPFLTAVKGFELHAPGPDGAVGTGDDVRDPFERVLKSGTPYAKAVSEDRLVDAKFDLEVGDATVSNWESLFQELTGQAIGDSFGAGGLGLSGVGEGGGGRGSGIGLGSVGTVGHGRGTSSIANGVAFWSVPRRTDANGHLRIHVPLGDIETTWRVALVGVPDGSRPATTGIDVPVALPLSARVDAGATWVAGDRVSAAVTLRNRTSAPIHATVEATPGGVALLPEGKPGATKTTEIDIPASAAQVIILPLHANVAGEGSLAVTVKAPGLPDDQLRHTWQVIPPGEPTDLSRSQWVEQSGELAITVDPVSMRLRGKPRLVLERGFDEALRAALDAIDPDRLRTAPALVDAMEVASRLERWATQREGRARPRPCAPRRSRAAPSAGTRSTRRSSRRAGPPCSAPRSGPRSASA
ncbi:MAG: alpha-2-macroglobulin family protein [Byssovorax sp.]